MPSPTPTWLRVLAGAVLVLNLADAVFTLVYTEAGVATEANPLMGSALRESPIAFMAVKLALVSLGVWLLWHWRTRRSAIAGLVAATTAYASLFVYHVSAATRFVSLDVIAIR